LSGSFKVLRLIDHFRHAPAGAAFNMALDEALLESACKGQSPPTLRLYGWSEPSVSLGRHQRASDVDMGFCRQRSIPVVRRPTGGRAILHGLELTYSFSAHLPLPGFGQSVLDSYGALSRAFMHAFKRLGLAALNGSRRKKGPGPGGANPLCFASASYGEISVRGKKIIGSAQRRCTDGFLQQGSIPLELDRETMAWVFYKAGGDADNGMAALGELDGSITLEGLKDAVVNGFRDVFSIDVARSGPDEREEELAARLAERKYLSEHWTLRR